MRAAKSQGPNPKSQSEQLQETARTLLKDEKADLVIGYERGSSKRRARPVVIRDEKDVDRLIFDNTCGPSVVPHLRKALKRKDGHGRAPKVAVVAKGCDGRALVQQIAEGQLKRDRRLSHAGGPQKPDDLARAGSRALTVHAAGDVHFTCRPRKLVDVASTSSTDTRSPGPADDAKFTGLCVRVRPITSPGSCRLARSTITSIARPTRASLRSLPIR